MKFIQILFSTEMVQAIQAGRKTQTRRVVKPQPPKGCEDNEPCIDWCDYDHKKGFQRCYASWETVFHPDGFHTVVCPYGKVGDVLWVRETFMESDGEYFYKADYDADDRKYISWKPSLFMPKSAARIFLKITNIRVERLNDISEEDAIKEGIEELHVAPFVICYKDYFDTKAPLHSDPIFSFCTLWQSINGIGSWELNPWVWVIEFERIEKPQNFLS